MYKLALLLTLFLSESGLCDGHLEFVQVTAQNDVMTKGYRNLPYHLPTFFDMRPKNRRRYYWKINTKHIAKGKPYTDHGYHWFAHVDPNDGFYAILADSGEQHKCLTKIWEKYDEFELVVFNDGFFYTSYRGDDAMFFKLKIDHFITPCK